MSPTAKLITMTAAALVMASPSALAQANGTGVGAAVHARDLASLDGQRAASRLLERAQSRGMIRVIIGLDVAMQDEDELTATEEAAQVRALARVQDGVAWRSVIPAGRVRKFETIPYMSAFVTPTQLRRLLGDPQMVSIQEDIPQPPLKEVPDAPMLDDSVPLIGAKKVWNKGYTGRGRVVAVLDTGSDHTHPMLKNKLVAGLCRSSNTTFTDNGNTYKSKSVCPGGVEVSNKKGSGKPCPANVDGCDHGTHVASIAVGSSGQLKGVARAAKFIAGQVFSRFPASFCGSSPCALSWTTDQISALERIFQLRNQFKIASVNMSLGGGSNSNYCDGDARAAIIGKLFNKKIATVIASGNDGFNGSIGAPACIKKAVAVGSTTKSDDVSPFSNHADIVDVMAPGSFINAAQRGGGYVTFSGTSMATPHVAGAWALLKQAFPGAKVNEIQTALRKKGVPVKRAGITKRRIDVNKALNYLQNTL